MNPGKTHSAQLHACQPPVGAGKEQAENWAARVTQHVCVHMHACAHTVCKAALRTQPWEVRAPSVCHGSVSVAPWSGLRGAPTFLRMEAVWGQLLGGALGGC